MKRAVAWMLSAVLAASSTSAFADPTAADKETARGLMAEGRSKREKGDKKGALEAFRAAHKIMGVPTTGLEAGRAEAELGLLIEARDTLLAVARIPVKPGEPEPFAKARDEAEKLADEIAPRIPGATLIPKGLPADAVATVTIDGVEVSGVLGVSRKMNPGEHVVVVRAAGRERSTSFTLAEGEKRDVEIDFAAATTVAKEEPKKPTPVVDHGSRASGLAITGFVIAGVGLVAGSVTGAMHLSKTSSLKERCANDLCGPEAHDDYNSAKTLGTVSTISFAVAGAGAVLGVIGLLTSKSKTETTTAGVHVYITGTSAGVYGAF